MSSSRSAQLVLAAYWLVATLLISSAHFRILRSQRPPAQRYLAGWFVCTILLAGLLTLTDSFVGVSFRRVGVNSALAALVSAAALGAGALQTARPAWMRMSATARAALLVVSTGIAVLTAMPLL